MSDAPLFQSFSLGSLQLKNRVVMAPMTRCRAIGNVPNALMASYYAARADAGLLVTEGTAPDANGLGYARIPGLFSEDQVAGWRGVTDAVHEAGGAIFAQLMHTGRVGHPLNMVDGARLLAPSAIACPGEMWTDQNGPQPYPVPEVMDEADIEATIEGYVTASRNAVAAGFDGVELHGANGYLIDQFLNAASNQRTDQWGGSVDNRARFALEVARRTAAAIGAEKVGIRLSPYGVFSGMAPDAEMDALYTYLAGELGKLGLGYVHVVDHSSMGAPAVSDAVKQAIRSGFGGTIILSGGYDRDRADADLAANKGELVAFGRPFLGNPDLVAKLRDGGALADFDFQKAYTPGADGYTELA
ncbi:MAG: alkene reductase [Deltaproteobacteria bacterium]|nr:alkene reductase [Deltaproteobacteria bacterium]